MFSVCVSVHTRGGGTPSTIYVPCLFQRVPQSQTGGTPSQDRMRIPPLPFLARTGNAWTGYTAGGIRLLQFPAGGLSCFIDILRE